MSFVTKLGVGLTSGLGITGISIGGIHYGSVETIGSKINNEVLGTTEDFDDAWSDQFKKLEKETEIPSSLRLIKDKHKGDNKSGGKAVKEWCQTTYTNTYRSKFAGPYEEDLKVAKKFCILSLSERLKNSFKGDDKILAFDGSDEGSHYQTNYGKIQNHDYKTMGKLPKELSDLKNHTGAASTKWNIIQSFCKQKVPTPFRNIDDFKIVKKYCTKNSSD